MDFKGYGVAYDYTAKSEKEKRQKEKEVLNFIKMIESKYSNSQSKKQINS